MTSDIVTGLPDSTFSRDEYRSRPLLDLAVSKLPDSYLDKLVSVVRRKNDMGERDRQINEDNEQSFRDDLRYLTMSQIIGALPPSTFTTSETRRRGLLEDASFRLPRHQRDVLLKAALSRKRKRVKSSEEDMHDVAVKKARVASPFLETVSDECRKDRIIKFIEATGNNALAMCVCSVCAGRFHVSEVRDVLVSHLKDKNKLAPFATHPSHVLTDGMLLHRSPNTLHTTQDGESMANVCDSCVHYLRRNKTPPLALANGMWIGDVPTVLDILTLPERILVARYFPAAYIVKLYPQQKGACRWPSQGMQSGLRGNVSTYRLNTNDIAKMSDTQTMPPSSSILAVTDTAEDTYYTVMTTIVSGN